MAIDQIEYCGSCEHYATCKARLGNGVCQIDEDESNGVVTDPLAEEEVWVP